MTFGEKLKKARKKAGLSQEQMAEKITVSRSAVAKWENNNGMPDINNLKALSQLLEISIDYLLDDEGHLDFTVLKEPIDFHSFKSTDKCRDQYDAVVLAKFPNATSIIPLIRKKVLSKTEHILEWTIMPSFGAFDIVDQVNNFGGYFLVESDEKQYIVSVTKEFIISSEIVKKITKKKFVIGKNKYRKVRYNLI
ncbi:MAG TPA: helix-turn-helix domain-containing protein [Bacillota bacterium]|nr:helix-turn-helix domain-containing protein [Bacillota bacterium]